MLPAEPRWVQLMRGASSACPQLVSQASAPLVSRGHLMGTTRAAVLLQHGRVPWVLPVGLLPQTPAFLRHASPHPCWPQSQTPRRTQSVSRGRDAVEFLLLFPGLLMSKLRGCCKGLSGRRHSRAAWGQRGRALPCPGGDSGWPEGPGAFSLPVSTCFPAG